MFTQSRIKNASKSLQKIYNTSGQQINYTQSLEMLSTMFGYDDYHHFKNNIQKKQITHVKLMSEKIERYLDGKSRKVSNVKIINDVIITNKIICFPDKDDFICLYFKNNGFDLKLCYLLNIDDFNLQKNNEISKDFALKHYKYLKDILIRLNILKYIPESKMSYELIKNILYCDGEQLQYVPEKYFSLDVFKIALRSNGMALKHIPDEYITKELCELALRKGGSFRYVPDRFKDLEMCKFAVDLYANNAQKYISNLQQYSNALPLLPHESINTDMFSPLFFTPDNILKNIDFCNYALSQFNFGDALISYQRFHNINESDLNQLVELNPYYIRYINDETYQMAKTAIQHNGDFFRWISINNITPELCFEAIKNSYSTYALTIYNKYKDILYGNYSNDEMLDMLSCKEFFSIDKVDKNSKRIHNKDMQCYTELGKNIPYWLQNVNDINELDNDFYDKYEEDNHRFHLTQHLRYIMANNYNYGLLNKFATIEDVLKLQTNDVLYKGWDVKEIKCHMDIGHVNFKL